MMKRVHMRPSFVLTKHAVGIRKSNAAKPTPQASVKEAVLAMREKILKGEVRKLKELLVRSQKVHVASQAKYEEKCAQLEVRASAAT